MSACDVFNQLYEIGSQTMDPEDEQGHIEYKARLDYKSAEKLDKMRSQMRWRLHEGDGTMFYVLGVYDDGRPVNLNSNELQKSETVLKACVIEKEGYKVVDHYTHREDAHMSVLQIEGEPIVELGLFF